MDEIKVFINEIMLRTLTSSYQQGYIDCLRQNSWEVDGVRYVRIGEHCKVLHEAEMDIRRGFGIGIQEPLEARYDA